jgi:hypothetical protein
VSEQPRGKLTRRTFLTVAGAGAGVVAAGAVASVAMKGGSGDRTAPPAPVPEASAEVRALFGDLAGGGKVEDWTVVRVHGVYYGAIPVVLATASGTKFQVDVMRRDPNGPEGVGNTPSLSLFVSNKGDGAKQTTEDHGLGAIALAEALAAREQTGAPIPPVVTLAQRHEKFPDGVYSVL